MTVPMLGFKRNLPSGGPVPRPAPLRFASLVTSIIAIVVMSISAPARADPPFRAGENAHEDALVDGDFDEEDHIAMHLGGHATTSDLHGQSWLSLAGFGKQLMSGRNDVGGILVVGLALDRIAAGPTHRLADPPRPTSHPPSPLPVAPPASPSAAPTTMSSGLARDAVSAALRTAGLDTDDARLDALVSRARASAWLPETRLRGMRLWSDALHTTTLASTDTANFYDAVGANLVLELRLTWRLDRLLYAGDEPTIERVRLERLDARSRLANRTLELLFAWERATVEASQAIAGSREELDAQVRAAEARATLDVLTAGWFTERSLPPAAPTDAGLSP
jgi:hypothetical protein